MEAKNISGKNTILAGWMDRSELNERMNKKKVRRIENKKGRKQKNQYRNCRHIIHEQAADISFRNAYRYFQSDWKKYKGSEEKEERKINEIFIRTENYSAQFCTNTQHTLTHTSTFCVGSFFSTYSMTFLFLSVALVKLA